MLRIRKEFKQPDGTVIEVEGTEAEVEAYEKKQTKKNESAQRKKEILHGKRAKSINIDELKQFLSQEIQKLAAIREVNQWYFNNGWWWRPWYFNNSWTYIYSQNQPQQNFNGDTSTYCTTSNATDVCNKIGLKIDDITSKAITTHLNNSNWSSIGGLKLTNTYGTITTGGTYTTNCSSLTDSDIQSVVDTYTVN